MEYELGLKRPRVQATGYYGNDNNINEFIACNVPANFANISNWRQWASDPVSRSTVVSKDYMDKELLPCGLQNLMQPDLWDSKHLNRVSHELTSPLTSVPACMTSPGFGNAVSFGHQLSYSTGANNRSNDYANTNLNKSVFFEAGSLYEIYNMHAAASSLAGDGKNILPPLGMKQGDQELVASPEQISSITACSNVDTFSDTEAFDGETALPDSLLQCISSSSSENYILQCLDQGDYRGLSGKNPAACRVEIPQLLGEYVQPYSNAWIPQEVLKSIRGTLYPLPTTANTRNSSGANLFLGAYQIPGSGQFDQWAQQLYSEHVDQSKARSNWCVWEENKYYDQKMMEAASKVPQPCSEQLQLVNEQAASESSTHMSKHDILSQYITYKSMPEDMKRDIPFTSYMHSTVCLDQRCKCEHYSQLASHFDNCNNPECKICGPVHIPLRTSRSHLGSRIREDDLSGAFYDGLSYCMSTGTLIDILPPSKRPKNVNQTLLSKVVSQEVAPSVNQLCSPERLPPLEQWPEAHVSNDVQEVKKTLFSPTEGPTVTCATTEDMASDVRNVYNAQLVVDYQCGQIEIASTSDFVNIGVVNPLERSTGTVLVSSEEPTDHSVEAIEVGSRGNQAILEANCGTSSLPTEDDLRLEAEDTKVQGVTLADIFTEAQIKEHLLSFSTWKFQEGTANTIGSVGQNTCQLCAKDKLVFAPAPLYCSSCSNRIKQNLIYYSTLDEKNEKGTKLSFCTSCFKGSRGANIIFRGISVSKAKLEKVKNNEEKEDTWVLCDRCHNWQHRVCGLYNDKRDTEGKAEYICPKCCLIDIESGRRHPLPVTAAFGANNLPSTNLSDYLEQRLLRRLKQEREETAKFLGKKLEEVPVATDLVVRVVVSVNKKEIVKQQFLDIFHEEDYPAEFLYRSKVIKLFQRIEGIDVCLFSMSVQEFGSECCGPNNRCVYISYLDSVKYFRPERKTATGGSLRTFVYHEILIGYLEYCKNQGFTTCYIWVCPLIKGEDYIFYSHPETQKTPNQDKLRTWYKSMLKKAVDDGIVVDVTNLYDRFFIPTGEGNTKITAARLPYFNGDFWSSAAVEIVQKIEQEEGGGGSQKKLSITNRTLKTMGHTSNDATKDVLVMQKLGQTILPLKENFLIIHLEFACSRCDEVIISGSRWFCRHCKKIQLCSRCYDMYQHQNARKMHGCNCSEKYPLSEVVVNGVPVNIKNEDTVLENTFFDTRESFLINCQKDNYLFDTLGNAKYSTMMILYHFIHKQSTIGVTCNICSKDILSEQCWQCAICPKFNVCDSCYQMKGGTCHAHKLSQPSTMALSGTKKKQQPPPQQIVVPKELLEVLMHSSKCEVQMCSNILCAKIRKLFTHARQCKVRARGGCRHCHLVWSLLMEHSLICSDSDCRIPRCMDLKNHRLTRQRAAVEAST